MGFLGTKMSKGNRIHLDAQISDPVERKETTDKAKVKYIYELDINHKMKKSQMTTILYGVLL